MIGLVACSAKKLPTAAPARELYSSPLFRKSLQYAEARCEHVYVLSALHHLVPLDQIVQPYEQRVAPRKSEKKQWGSIVAASLEARHGRDKHDLLILAGEDYAKAIIDNVEFWWTTGTWRRHIHLPLARMQIGARLRWLNSELGNATNTEGV